MAWRSITTPDTIRMMGTASITASALCSGYPSSPYTKAATTHVKADPPYPSISTTRAVMGLLSIPVSAYPSAANAMHMFLMKL
jgi:hypothetical protein